MDKCKVGKAFSKNKGLDTESNIAWVSAVQQCLFYVKCYTWGATFHIK